MYFFEISEMSGEWFSQSVANYPIANLVEILQGGVRMMDCKKWWILNCSVIEAGGTFDNSFFDNYFDLVRQLKNRLFLGPVFVHVTG